MTDSNQIVTFNEVEPVGYLLPGRTTPVMFDPDPIGSNPAWAALLDLADQVTTGTDSEVLDRWRAALAGLTIDKADDFHDLGLRILVKVTKDYIERVTDFPTKPR